MEDSLNSTVMLVWSPDKIQHCSGRRGRAVKGMQGDSKRSAIVHCAATLPDKYRCVMKPVMVGNSGI